MASSPVFTKLLGDNELTSRVQQAIDATLRPVAMALAATPIMGADPPAWRATDLLNGWTNLNATNRNFPPFGYHKDALGYVHLRGYLVAGTLNVTCALLPMGYRPAYRMTFPGYVFNGASVTGDIEVRPEGNIVLLVPALTTNVALDSITFLAEQ